MDFILFLSKKSGRDILTQDYLKIFNDCIRDPFQSIRKKVAELVVEFLELFGEDWVKQHLLPGIFMLEMDRHCKYRLAFCQYVQRLCYEFKNPVTKKMQQSLFSLAADSIAIVRIGSAKAIGDVMNHEKCSAVSYNFNSRI